MENGERKSGLSLLYKCPTVMYQPVGPGSEFRFVGVTHEALLRRFDV